MGHWVLFSQYFKCYRTKESRPSRSGRLFYREKLDRTWGKKIDSEKQHRNDNLPPIPNTHTHTSATQALNILSKYSKFYTTWAQLCPFLAQFQYIHLISPTLKTFTFCLGRICKDESYLSSEPKWFIETARKEKRKKKLRAEVLEESESTVQFSWVRLSLYSVHGTHASVSRKQVPYKFITLETKTS